MVGQGHATWPDEDYTDVTLGKRPFLGAGPNLLSPAEPRPHFLGGRIEGSSTGWEILPQNRLAPSFPPQHQSCNPTACTGPPHAPVPHLSLLKSQQDLGKNYL